MLDNTDIRETDNKDIAASAETKDHMIKELDVSVDSEYAVHQDEDNVVRVDRHPGRIIYSQEEEEEGLVDKNEMIYVPEDTDESEKVIIEDRKIKTRKTLLDSRLFRTAVGILLAVGVFLFAKYGWRYMGFQMTTDPAYITVFSTGENTADDTVWVTGSSPMNLGTFAGYVDEVDEKTGTWYVGIRFNLSGGNNTDFRIIRPQTDVRINRIVLKKNNIERVIWERGKGVIGP